jgi:hypothetical protein
MTRCGTSLTYTAVTPVRYICTKAAGHKGPHFDADAPISWTALPPYPVLRRYWGK